MPRSTQLLRPSGIDNDRAGRHDRRLVLPAGREEDRLAPQGVFRIGNDFCQPSIEPALELGKLLARQLAAVGLGRDRGQALLGRVGIDLQHEFEQADDGVEVFLLVGILGAKQGRESNDQDQEDGSEHPPIIATVFGVRRLVAAFVTTTRHEVHGRAPRCPRLKR